MTAEASPRRLGPLAKTAIFVIAWWILLQLAVPALGGWLAAPGWMSFKHGLRSTGQEFTLYYVLGLFAWYCHLTYDDERWAEFWRPVFAFLRVPSRTRLAVLVVTPLAVGGLVFAGQATGSSEPVMNPIRHPTPPDDFSKLTNPFRSPTPELLDAFDQALTDGKIVAEDSTEPTVRQYAAALKAGTATPDAREIAHLRHVTEEGRTLFFINCRPCHGTKAMGDGPMSVGQRREPADFTGVETIATLVEGAVFWRVRKGGVGLPREGAPWETAMPKWETDLSDEQIWKIITAEYDIAGNRPREPEVHE